MTMRGDEEAGTMLQELAGLARAVLEQPGDRERRDRLVGHALDAAGVI